MTELVILENEDGEAFVGFLFVPAERRAFDMSGAVAVGDVPDGN